MLDTSIPMQGQPFAPENPLNGLAQLFQIQGARQQNQLGALQLQEAQRQNKLQQTVRGLLDVNMEQGPDGTPQLNQGRFTQDLTKLGYGDKALEYQQQFTTQKAATRKAGLENEQLDANTKKALLEHTKTSLELASHLASTATDQTSWDRALQLAGAAKLDISQMPRRFDPAVAKQIADSTKTAADKLAEQKEAFEQGPKFTEEKRHHDMQHEVGLAQAANSANSGTKPQRLPADKAVALSDQRTGVEMLDKMYGKITTLRGNNGQGDGKLTPILGPLRSMNPWDTHAQTMNQYTASVKQIIGKSLEGGVLRKEDEVKYEKVIPKQGDLPEVLTAKYRQLRDMLATKRNNEIETFNQTGYVTGGVEKTAPLSEGVPASRVRPAGAPQGRVQASKNGGLIYRPGGG